MYLRYRIGNLYFLPDRNLLLIGEDSRSLDSKQAQLLLLLIEKQGETLSRAQILEQVWEGRAVSEDVVSVAISHLRKAMGDQAKNPKYIKTEPGNGYRLIMPVFAEPETTAREVLSKNTRPSYFFGALLIFFVILSWFFWKWSRGAAPTALIAPDQVVAVLPIEVISDSEEAMILGRGLTALLTAELVHEGRFPLVSGSSAAVVAGENLRLTEKAERLGADLVLSGSLWLENENVLLDLQLVDGKQDRYLWSHRFREHRDDFASRLELLVRSVAVELAGREKPERMLVGTASGQKDQTLILQADYLSARGGEGDFLAAAEKYQAVLETQPDHVGALLGLAKTRMALAGRHQGSAQNADASTSPVSLLQRAHLLAPHHPEVTLWLANYWFFQKQDATRAGELYRQALEHGPYNAHTHFFYSQFCLAEGDFNAAIQHAEQVRRLDPLAYSRPVVAWIYNMAGRYEDALVELEAQSAVNGLADMGRASLLKIYENMGREEDAFELYLLFLEEAGYGEYQERFRNAFLSGGLAGFSEQLLALDVREDIGQYSAPLSTARYQITAGRFEDALDSLEQAYDQKRTELLWLGVDPKYKPLHGRPRFRMLLEKIGFPSHH